MTADVTVPTFVVRGLPLLSDGRDWRTQWRTEADLRDALATVWWLHGADVRTEVKVPNCGRIDILVEHGRLALIVEVKRKITTTGEAFEAFRQAHAYYAFLSRQRHDAWPGGDYETAPLLYAAVTAATFARDVAGPVQRAYGEVDGMAFGTALAEASNGCISHHDCRASLRASSRLRAAAIGAMSAALRDADLDLVASQESLALRDLLAGAA